MKNFFFHFKIFYEALLFLDKLSSKRLIYEIIRRFFQEDLYIEKKSFIKEFEIFVLILSQNWRVKTLFDQEPETLEWIDTFQNDKKIIQGSLVQILVFILSTLLQSTKTFTVVIDPY